MSDIRCPLCGKGPLPVARNMRSSARCNDCKIEWDDAYRRNPIAAALQPVGDFQPNTVTARMRDQYKLSVRGPGLNVEFTMETDEDFVMLEALLAKVRKSLEPTEVRGEVEET